MTFAERLRELRNRKDWSQTKLAAESGLTLRRIEDWEQGLSEPRWSDLRKLAQALGVTVSDFEQPEQV